METCEKDSCDENTQFQSDPDKYSVTIFVGVTLKLVNLKWYFLYVIKHLCNDIALE